MLVTQTSPSVDVRPTSGPALARVEVLAQLEGALLLRVGGKTMQAHTDLPLAVGARFTARVSISGDSLVLRPVATDSAPLPGGLDVHPDDLVITLPRHHGATLGAGLRQAIDLVSRLSTLNAGARAEAAAQLAPLLAGLLFNPLDVSQVRRGLVTLLGKLSPSSRATASNSGPTSDGSVLTQLARMLGLLDGAADDAATREALTNVRDQLLAASRFSLDEDQGELCCALPLQLDDDRHGEARMRFRWRGDDGDRSRRSRAHPVRFALQLELPDTPTLAAHGVARGTQLDVAIELGEPRWIDTAQAGVEALRERLRSIGFDHVAITLGHSGALRAARSRPFDSGVDVHA